MPAADPFALARLALGRLAFATELTMTSSAVLAPLAAGSIVRLVVLMLGTCNLVDRCVRACIRFLGICFLELDHAPKGLDIVHDLAAKLVTSHRAPESGIPWFMLETLQYAHEP